MSERTNRAEIGGRIRTVERGPRWIEKELDLELKTQFTPMGDLPSDPSPTVHVSQMLLSNLGNNDRKWSIETLAIAALNEKLPDGFKDEFPKAAVLQIEIPFQVMKTGIDTKSFSFFTTGNFGSVPRRSFELGARFDGHDQQELLARLTQILRFKMAQTTDRFLGTEMRDVSWESPIEQGLPGQPSRRRSLQWDILELLRLALERFPRTIERRSTFGPLQQKSFADWLVQRGAKKRAIEGGQMAWQN